MTRSHRHRHRRVWITLAVLLPLAFIAGLLARRPVPVMSGETHSITLPPANLAPR